MLTAIYLITSKWHTTNDTMILLLSFMDFLIIFMIILAVLSGGE
jgi:hypothetical protein